MCGHGKRRPLARQGGVPVPRVRPPAALCVGRRYDGARLADNAVGRQPPPNAHACAYCGADTMAARGATTVATQWWMQPPLPSPNPTTARRAVVGAARGAWANAEKRVKKESRSHTGASRPLSRQEAVAAMNIAHLRKSMSSAVKSLEWRASVVKTGSP